MTTFDPDALIDALAPLMGVPVTADSRPHVKTHLVIAATHAATLLAAELGDEEEPAPVFTP